VRCTEGAVIAAGLALWALMSTSRSRRFPVTVTHLPVTRCQICHRMVAYRPGSLSEVLTEHYRRAHPRALGILPGWHPKPPPEASKSVAAVAKRETRAVQAVRWRPAGKIGDSLSAASPDLSPIGQMFQIVPA
jgi:hypothetical protein